MARLFAFDNNVLEAYLPDCKIQHICEPYLKEERMFGIGMPELIVILVIILIIFGAGKLPQIGEGIGKGIRNFRKSTKDEEIDVTPKKSEEISEKK